MKIESTPIADVVVVRTERRGDGRGAFSRFFCEEELADLLGGRRIVQINHSVTRAPGTVRGMHFQHAPHAETKFVRCLRGRAWDVALDLRAGSPTFLKWRAHELDAEQADMLVIPPGCAHGFQALEPDTELLYLHTAAYAPQAEDGVDAADPHLAIAWPLPLAHRSPRDIALRRVDRDFKGLVP
ncbi:dTDP-4-dehydrorhamnose 3,5-epimerase family protein [Caenimonas aquaedulcis]|uniref:dTDP-4-dehydrorhamnose 3,5-epimerase n=1 Tax=Caenimonas aquaedulcis TaxID=2793270 RepID=A0A931MHL7_9BURK|nr:dTDP-4-dehydrorhamnose 3,5-epimerase family protein [Caenimonas aquaedulcis]MBG9388879.1 dTDP-4-dehydrorhamnose 3,5-epimerase family protein [Caenimonas aquaedulcis]